MNLVSARIKRVLKVEFRSNEMHSSICNSTYHDDIVNLNKKIESYLPGHSTSKSKIKVVDQYTGVVPSKDMFDDLHLNAKGEKITAERWFQSIKEDFKNCDNFFTKCRFF